MLELLRHWTKAFNSNLSNSLDQPLTQGLFILIVVIEFSEAKLLTNIEIR